MVGCQKWWDVKKLNSEFLSSNNAMYWEQNGVPCKSPAMKFLKSSQVFICNKWETKYRIRILNLCGEFSGRRILRVEDAGKSNLHSSRPFAPHLWGGNLWMLPFEGGSRYQLGDRIFSCLGHSHLSKGEVSAWQINGHFVTKRWMNMTRMKMAIVREDSGYQNGCIFGKVPNSLRPPSPHFWKTILQIFGDMGWRLCVLIPFHYHIYQISSM